MTSAAYVHGHLVTTILMIAGVIKLRVLSVVHSYNKTNCQ